VFGLAGKQENIGRRPRVVVGIFGRSSPGLAPKENGVRIIFRLQRRAGRPIDRRDWCRGKSRGRGKLRDIFDFCRDAPDAEAHTGIGSKIGAERRNSEVIDAAATTAHVAKTSACAIRPPVPALPPSPPGSAVKARSTARQGFRDRRSRGNICEGKRVVESCG